MAGDNEKNDEKNVDFTALDEILKEIGEEGAPQKDKKYIYKPWDQGKNKTQYTYSGADTEAETEEDIILEEDQPTDITEEDIEVEGEKEEITEEEGENELPEGHFHQPIEEDEEDKFVNELLSVLDKRIKWEDVRQIDEKEREITDSTEEEAVIKDENIPELEFKRPSIEKKVGERYNEDYTPKEEESVFEKYSDILGEIEGVELEEDAEQPQEEEDLTDNIEVVNEEDIEDEYEEPEEEEEPEENTFEISDEEIMGDEEEEPEEDMKIDEDKFKFDEGEPEEEEEPFQTDIEEDNITTDFDTLDIEEQPEEEKEERPEDEFDFEEHETEEEKEEITEIDTGSASIFGSTEDIVSSTEDIESSTEEDTEEIEGEEEMAEPEEEKEEQPEDEFDFEEHETEEEKEEAETEHEFDFEEPDLEEEKEEVDTFTDSDGMETLSDDADVADLFGEEDTEEVIEGKEDTEPETDEESGDEFGPPEIEEDTEPETDGESGDEFGFPEIEEDEEEDLEDFSLSTESLESDTSDDIFDGTHYEEGEEDLSKELDENIPVGTDEEDEDIYEEETTPVETEKTSESIELSEDEFDHIKKRLEELPEPTASEARDVIINEKLNKQDMRVLIDLLVNERPYSEVQNYLDKKLGKKKPSMPAGVYILITVLLLGVIAYLVLMIMGINPIQSLQANAEGQNLINRGVEILNSTPGEEASERAERLFNRAIEKNPNNVDYYLKYADMYLRRNEPEKALEKLLGDRSPDPAAGQ